MRQNNRIKFSGRAFLPLAHLVVTLLSACGIDADSREQTDEIASMTQGLSIKRTYDKNWAARYAQNSVYKVYGVDNPFKDYPATPSGYGYIGGNCTNFVSQALVGGFIGSDNPATVYASRTDFAADKTSPLKWYWISDTDRGDAWTGAANLYKYAASNKPDYKGAHFRFITKDSKTSFMDVSLVDIGDIIFADWGGDGSINHSMIVTNIDPSVKPDKTANSYNRISITAQTNNVKNKSLAKINDETSKTAVFYVYRPEDYNPEGK